MKFIHFRRQRGFTLVELGVVAIGITLLAFAMMNPVLNQFREKKAELTAVRMATIAQGAQAHRIDTGQWPDQVNNCAATMTRLTTTGYITGISATSAYGTSYTFTCSVNIFNIRVDTKSADWASYIGGIIPAGSTAGTFVTMATPVTVPVFDNLLHRTAIAGRPELNRMETALDMNNQNIDNVAALEAVTGNITTVNSTTINNSGTATTNLLRWGNQAELNPAAGGSIELGGRDAVAGTGSPYIDFHNGASGIQNYNVRIINSANGLLELIASNGVRVTNDLTASGTINATEVIASGTARLTRTVQDVRIVENGNVVSKPTCPAGLAPGIVFAAETMAEGATPGAFYGYKAWATDNGAVWQANVRVFTASGAVTPAPGYGRVASFTFCY